jgi:hypothetical protein
MWCPSGRLLFAFALGTQVAPAQTLLAQDWPQLGANAARTNYVSQAVSPPYRARWIWCGPDHTLRNKAANPQWPDNLRPGHGQGADCHWIEILVDATESFGTRHWVKADRGWLGRNGWRPPTAARRPATGRRAKPEQCWSGPMPGPRSSEKGRIHG